MNQRLRYAQDILSSLEKNRELSFNEFSKILVKDKLNEDNFLKIRDKYYWIDDTLKWVRIFNSIWNRNVDYIRKINLYKDKQGWRKYIQNFLWNMIETPVDLYTIFKIENWEEFITSILRYIDNVKTDDWTTLASTLQRRKVTKILEEQRKKFGKESFTFKISIKKYFTDDVEYYKTISETPKLTIKNITIFDWMIQFSIEMKDSENIKDREIKWEEKWSFLIMYYWGREKKFKKWKNTYHIVKESLLKETNEIIDFAQMIEKLSGLKDQDKMKMVYNAVSYANKEIIKELKIEGFFWVEEKAYKRQLEVIGI